MGIENRILSYLREEIDRQNSEVLLTFRSNINMSYRELKDFLNSDKFLKSSINETVGDVPDINRAVLRISNKEDESLTDNDYDWMRQINASIDKIRNSDSFHKNLRLKSLGVDETKD